MDTGTLGLHCLCVLAMSNLYCRFGGPTSLGSAKTCFSKGISQDSPALSTDSHPLCLLLNQPCRLEVQGCIIPWCSPTLRFCCVCLLSQLADWLANACRSTQATAYRLYAAQESYKC